jgi:hypothetical protein
MMFSTIFHVHGTQCVADHVCLFGATEQSNESRSANRQG